MVTSPLEPLAGKEVMSVIANPRVPREGLSIIIKSPTTGRTEAGRVTTIVLPA